MGEEGNSSLKRVRTWILVWDLTRIGICSFLQVGFYKLQWATVLMDTGVLWVKEAKPSCLAPLVTRCSATTRRARQSH